MKPTLLTLFVLVVSSASRNASAETPQTPEMPEESAPSGSDSDATPLFSAVGHRVGRGIEVETTLLWPIFPGNLFQLRATVPVAWDGRVQLLLGAQGHIPHDRSAEGRFSTLAAHLGVRVYYWKGLHVDYMTNLGVGMLRGNVVDGKDYDSFDVELLAVAGWRFEFGSVYALVQPLGVGAVVYRSNPWETVGEGRKTSESPIFVGNIALGVQF